MHRRNFLKASALAPAAAALCATPTLGLAEPASPLSELANQLDVSLFAPDGLAIPIADKPTNSPLAKGLDRTLALGGGGTYYLAWYCGFFYGLFDEGVDAPSLA
jgi:NTE family protein